MISLGPSYLKDRKLTDMVENRTVHTLSSAELNIFETHQVAQNVALKFNEPLLVSMVKGKKLMNLSGLPTFGFSPGESVLLPSYETMKIDFPEATLNKPTQCLALAIAKERVDQTIHFLNQRGAKVSGGDWAAPNFNFRLTNDNAINHILQRLIFVFTENHPSKDVFSEMLISELIIRVLQTENKQANEQIALESSNSNSFSFILKYIKENLTNSISVESLSKLAYMSESKFYKTFKEEFGISPNEYVIEERLKLAENLLLQKEISVKEAYLSSGFNSFSYFSKLFKKRKNLSPSEFKAKYLIN